MALDPIPYRWVEDDAAFTAVVDELVVVDRYAIDTEFHRERTYFPSLALVQIAWNDGLVLIDPLSVDIRGLARLFDTDVEAVFHAPQQDIDVLTHAVGAVPKRIFDTQIAGSFLGYGNPSLVALLAGELDVYPPKASRLTDWLKRPLTEAQCQYAASDVAFLLELADSLQARLVEVGRASWAAEAVSELIARPVSGTAPELAWTKLKDARGLRSSARSVAQQVAAWREEEAMRRNVPARQVFPDLAVLAIAQRRPTTLDQLRSTRGVDERANRSGVADAVLQAVKRGLESEAPERPTSSDELARELRPAVTLISAWVAQVAKDEGIDAAVLATRSDLVQLLAGRDDARLATGWRKELLGDGITRLLNGSAGLTFAGSDGLKLVPAGDVEAGE